MKMVCFDFYCAVKRVSGRRYAVITHPHTLLRFVILMIILMIILSLGNIWILGRDFRI